MISKWTNVRQNSRSFYWNTWDEKNTHPFIWGFCFPTDVMVHYPYYVQPAFVVRHRLIYGIHFHTEKPRMGASRAHPFLPWHCHIMCKIKNMRICYVIKKHVIGFTYSFSTAHRGSTWESGFFLSPTPRYVTQKVWYLRRWNGNCNHKVLVNQNLKKWQWWPK